MEINNDKTLKEQVEKRLSALRAGSPPAEVLAFVNKCDAWLETNKDNRGTTAEAIKDGYYCAIRLEQAMRARSHDDSSIRRLAEKTVTAMLHNSFPEIQERLRTLNGRVSKVGKRKADKRRQDAARAIKLGQRFELRELRSVSSLQRVGRTLKNCVANRSDAKNYLSDTDEEMWTLYELVQQRPLYLLQVDRSAKELRQIEGHNVQLPNWSGPLRSTFSRHWIFPPTTRKRLFEWVHSTRSWMDNLLWSLSRLEGVFTGSGSCEAPK